MTMLAPAPAKLQPLGTKDKPEVRIGKSGTGKCGFCNWPADAARPWEGEPDRTHDHCPIGTLNGNEVVITRCACPCAADWIKCLTCGYREHMGAGEVSTDNWRCADPDACHARIETRLNLNPTVRMIREIRARVTEEQRLERANRPRVVRLDEDGAPIPRRESTPRPTSGACLHCGEPTKGGKFLPGHDASYLSSTLAAIRDGATTLAETLGQWAGLGISDALQAKLTKRVI